SPDPGLTSLGDIYASEVKKGKRPIGDVCLLSVWRCFEFNFFIFETPAASLSDPQEKVHKP
ncbi:hypothetical protein QUF44_00150, partial [Bacillus subtilis]